MANIVDLDWLKAQLHGVSKLCVDAINRLITIYPGIPTDDFRLSIFTKANTVAAAIHIGIAGIEKAGSDGKSIYGGSSPDTVLWVENFDKLLRGGFFMNFFSSMESSWRGIMMELHSACGSCGVSCPSCGGGRGDFFQIYTCLLKEAGLTGGDEVKLLDLSRTIRNAIHNNYKHFPKKGNVGDKLILPYDGKSYEFIVGYPVNFLTWEFTLLLTSRLAALWELVSKHPKVHRLKYLQDVT